MDKKKILLIILGVAALIALLWPPIEKELNNKFVGTGPNIEVVTSANINGVKLICDASGSMRGYVDFKQITESAKNNIISNVTTFINRVDEVYSPNEFLAVCGNTMYSNIFDFRRELTSNKVFKGGQSFLWNLIDEGVRYASDSTVSVIVSDMVLSYGVDEIRRKGLNHNIVSLDGLKSNIETAMKDAKKNGLDVMVLQYLSDFNGHYYYNCQENLESLSPERKNNKYDNILMKNRPYYLMLIGSKDNLMSIVKDGCYAECNNMYASFVVAEPNLKEVNYDVKINDDKVWNAVSHPDVEDDGFYANYLPKDRTSFTISCSEFELPRYYYQNVDSFVVECEGPATVKVTGYTDNNIIMNLTTVPMNEFFNGRDAITNLDIYTEIDWYIGCSCDDDIVEESLENKTWGLTALFSGINSVYYRGSVVTKSKVGTLSIHYVNNYEN